jgi:hypothetical protein
MLFVRFSIEIQRMLRNEEEVEWIIEATVSHCWAKEISPNFWLVLLNFTLSESSS